MKKRDLILRAVGVAAIVFLLVVFFVKPVYSSDEKTQQLWQSVVLHAAGSVAMTALLLLFRYPVFEKKFRLSSLAVLLPCLSVVVNNLPILSLAWGDAAVSRDDLVWVFAVDCLLIGVMEELIFRGILYMMILERFHANRKQIFWGAVVSSAVFGLIHLTNLLEGAGIVGTLMQVGYSFLIGGMCSIVLLKTGNLWYCVGLHALYDFCGNLLPTLGQGTWWDTPTIVITAVLATLVTGWMLYVLFRVTPEEAGRFFPPSEQKRDKE